jgi:hypothetical protein
MNKRELKKLFKRELARYLMGHTENERFTLMEIIEAENQPLTHAKKMRIHRVKMDLFYELWGREK